MSVSSKFIELLTKLLPIERILQDPADCWVYGYDNSRMQVCPEVVVFPLTESEVVAIVKLCQQFQVSLVARGKGTGTTGAAVPLQKGLVLSLEKMQTILAFEPENRLMIVEPGVTNQQVQELARSKGLMWASDPSSSSTCTVGGNLAVNAAGPRAVKYGTCRENTLGLTAITGTGAVLKTGVVTTKGVVGYDLTRLIIGSEGTLAIITQATLKLLPLAEHKYTAGAFYDSIQAATNAIVSLMSNAIVPCTLEFLDEASLSLIRSASNFDIPENARAMLIFELDGDPETLALQFPKLCQMANVDHLLKLMTATTESERQALWLARKSLSPALRKLATHKINEDVVVPITRIPSLLQTLQMLAQQYQINIVTFGHAGNGNLHINLMYDDTQSAKDAAKLCLNEIFNTVLALRGTLSGEHGIGYVKAEFVSRELSSEVLTMMRAIKQQFDPANILNPNKIGLTPFAAHEIPQ